LSKRAPTILTHFPSGLPYEHIASRVTRFHIQSGNLSSLVTFQQLFERLPFSLSALVQPNLQKLASRLPGDARDNLDFIEIKSTLRPLFQQFYVGTEHKSGPKSQSVRWIVGEKGLMKICPHCLIADKEEHGWPYLHRSHQIPGITTCWRHGTALLERCPDCSCPYSLPNQLVETAWRGCSCGLNTKALASRPAPEPAKHEHQLAQFAHDLIEAESIQLTRAQLTQLYRQQAHALGMQYGAFRINRQLLIKRVSAFFGPALLSRIDPAFRKKSNTGWLKVFEEKSNTESPLYRHILMSFFLFRSYAVFREKAIAITQEVSQHDNLKSSIEQEAANAAHKLFAQLEQAALRYHSDITQLWASHTGTMRRLLKLDPAMFKQLEKRLQIMQRRRKKIQSRALTAKLADDDQLWAQAFEKAAKQLYEANDCPIWITKNRIIKLAQSQMKKKKSLTVDEYPMAIDILDTYAEGQWHFYARRLAWLLHSLIDTETPDHVIRTISGLEYHKCRAVIAHFADCPRGTGTSAQVVSGYLARKNILRNWSGPDPAREFDNPGRTYRLRTSRAGKKGELALRPYANHVH
jgi:hypothetical protein